MPPPVLIKKYGNRRLYDTGDSRYVTLDELAAKIRTGIDVRVVDAQTGEDLTQALLTQIVLETGHAAKFLPTKLLLQMIRLSDDALAEFFSRYVTSALDMYLQARRGVQTLASYAPVAQIPMAATDALARMWMSNPFNQHYPQPGPPPGYYGQAPYVAPPPPPDGEPLDVEAPPPDEPRADRSSRDRMERPPTHGRAATEDERSDEVALMRRELDELKQAIREGLSARPAAAPRKRKKT